jgi:hypothetical protein
LAAPLVDQHVARGRADRPALRLAERVISYGELLEHVTGCGVGVIPRTCHPEILSAAKDPQPRSYGSFASLRMTALRSG